MNNNLKFAKLRYMINKIGSSFKEEYISVIICAAGSGTRMGGVNKQLMLLKGKPCILYSLEKFQKNKRINEIIISAKAELIDNIREICDKNCITKVKSIVIGGKTRQESIENAFRAIDKKSNLLLIHDAARPAFSESDIDELIDNAYKYGAATSSYPCSDSIKLSDDNGSFIDKTVSRENLYLVQTPQVFKTDIYRIAIVMASKNKLKVTDDNQLVENAGFKIKLCNTSKYNIKLTTEEDIKIIESIL